MQWDWYQATIPDRADRVVGALAGAMTRPELREGKGLHGYAKRTDILDGGDLVASVLFGGSNGLPNAWASGQQAERFAGIVRREFPVHRVTRFDACEDFDEPGAFDRIVPVLLGLADRCVLKVNHAGDWHRAEDGRTLYIGSRKSACVVRWYEKGKQLRDQLASHGIFRPDWCRLEAQVRPHGSQRVEAATSSPTAAWGFSRWTPKVLQTVLGEAVRRAAPSTFLCPEYRESYMHMIRQYSSVLQRIYEDVGGSWEEVGSDIGAELRRMLEQRSPRLN